jgi:hypothetical protein
MGKAVANVTDSMTWEASEAALKKFLGLECADTTQDSRLMLYLAAATDAADTYMDNLFQDADGVDLPIPSVVQLGVYEYVRLAGETVGPDGLPVGVLGIATQKTGDLAVGYRSAAIAGSLSAETSDRLLNAVKNFWWSNRNNILL